MFGSLVGVGPRAGIALIILFASLAAILQVRDVEAQQSGEEGLLAAARSAIIVSD